MKLLRKAFSAGGPGDAKVVPEDGEDLWHAFNLIRPGDRVTATTFRKVTRDSGAGGDSERVKLKLTVAVEGVDYDGEGGVIRLKGRNLTESEHVRLGAYHSLELEPGRAFELGKDVWDALDAARLQEACDPAAGADLAALLITEGLATLCLVGRTCTVVRARVEVAIPRKRGAAAAGYDKALGTFRERAFAAVARHVDWEQIKCLVIAGPGFEKDGFRAFLDAEAQRREARPLLVNRANIVVAPASSAYKHALKEVLASPAVAGRVKDTLAARQTGAMSEFMATLAADPARAFYGPGHVRAAHELGAIATLLLSDALFRAADPAARRRYAALAAEVEAGGGKALVFSAAHASGEQLGQLTGIAAILRFPLPELEDQEFDPDEPEAPRP
jgi:protein pelota